MSEITIKQAKQLTDEEILHELKNKWGFNKDENIVVFGVFSIGLNAQTSKNFYTLKNVKSKNGKKLEYPLSDLDSRAKLYNSGIYIPYHIGEELIHQKKIDEELIIECQLVLASKEERTKEERIYRNPMLLSVKDEPPKILKKITKSIEKIEDNDNLYIEENIINYIYAKNQKKLNIDNEKLTKRISDLSDSIKNREKELDQLEEVFKQEYKVRAEDLAKKLERETYKLEIIEAQYEKKYIEEKSNLNKKLEEENNKLRGLQELYIKKTDQEKEKINAILNQLNLDVSLKTEEKEKLTLNIQGIKEDIELKKNEISILEEEIKQLQELRKEEQELMSKKLEKLRSFIKDKADALLELDFIDQDQYDELLAIQKKEESDELYVDFEKDLDNDKQALISHIQAYLFNKSIVYPRDIIEDFYALIQTNDLIVLAGESGSGKTNLVKSFAKAIGGVAIIIPVKPNWTSSEDLLGYYNPLEKKYLATPFLVALLEAKNNPNTPYFICLDEMNLARVEYYFADFLSLLEERGEQPEITLYSENESSHINTELKMVLSLIESTKKDLGKTNVDSYIDILKDREINQELKRVFGFSDKDSLIKYHAELKRMLSGMLGIPSSIIFPKNVRIIGAINIDETTHYLSPKILDRAHIMKFDSPLLYDWVEVANEIKDVKNKELKVKMNIEDLGTREEYPAFDLEDEFCNTIVNFTKKYFTPLGIEVGLRTIRQGLNYKEIFIAQGSNPEVVLNNYILHKILPKLTFAGDKEIDENGTTKLNKLEQFTEELKELIPKNDSSNYRYVIKELKDIKQNSEMNDKIVNYWA